MRRAIFGLCFCLGCQAWQTAPPEPSPPPSVRAPEPTPEVVPASYSAPSIPDIPPEPDALMLAAECLDSGDQDGAASHMIAHIEANPDQIMIRTYLAELLVKSNRDEAARRQFEQFIVEAQEQDGPAREHLIHCHTRLMEISIRDGDVYEEKLNRGIGLYLLSKAVPNPELREQLLCRALIQLNEAHELDREAARPEWYRYLVRTELGEFGAARDALHSAKEAAALSALTPTERLRLHIAVMNSDQRSRGSL